MLISKKSIYKWETAVGYRGMILHKKQQIVQKYRHLDIVNNNCYIINRTIMIFYARTRVVLNNRDNMQIQFDVIW